MTQDTLNICGCFHCGVLMSTKEIYEWTASIDQPETQTAICPYCGVNSVLIKISGNKVTKELMDELSKEIYLKKDGSNIDKVLQLTRD